MGAEGIAVGMATKIPPHNLTELVEAIIFIISKAKLIDKSKKDLTFNVTVEELLEYIKGPDFQTGGIIYGANDIKQAYLTGRGSILVRAKIEDEDMGH